MAITFELDPELTPELREAIVECWVAATNAGGAIGFVAPVDAATVRPVAEAAFTAVGSGTDRLLVGRVDGLVVGLLFIHDQKFALHAHWRTLKRVMVHPDHQGAGHGVALMREAERIAREIGLEYLYVTVRGGLGTEDFYAKCGYVEIGRFPRGLRLSADDYRDEITMVLPLL